MTGWPWWAGALAASPWLALPLSARLFGRGNPLRDYDPPARDQSPPVSVIVPARNEALRIERCVGSILKSDYPDFEVIVVDDRSTDATGAILATRAARDPRLRVISGAEVPEGWFGKPWACMQGARRARGVILLFTDADTWHGPGLLGRAVGMLRATGADLVTLLQRQEMRTFWERLIQPHVFSLLGAPIVLLTAGRPSRINGPAGQRHAIANGQFIMVTRASYDAIGGHEAVRGEVVEDLMIAKAYVAAQRRRWFANAMDDMATRMYTSLGEIVEGWSKNLFVAATRLFGPVAGYLAMAGIAATVLLGLAPVVALAYGLLAAAPAWIAFGAAGSALGVLTAAIFLARNGEPARYAALFWLGEIVLLYILARSTLRGTRRIEWKGRTYRHA